MEQLKKSFIIIIIMLIGILCVNIFFMAQDFLKHTPDIVIKFSMILKFVCLTSTFFIVPSSDINNPDRYEFVKTHYFTPEDLASFPDEIPEDATNVILSYNEDIFNSSRKSLLLEYDSNTITSDNHHANFYVEVDQ